MLSSKLQQLQTLLHLAVLDLQESKDPVAAAVAEDLHKAADAADELFVDCINAARDLEAHVLAARAYREEALPAIWRLTDEHLAGNVVILPHADFLRRHLECPLHLKQQEA